MQRKIDAFDDAIEELPYQNKDVIKADNYTAVQSGLVMDHVDRLQNVIIDMHVKPDPDAWGSAIALVLYLKQRNINAAIYAPDEKSKQEMNQTFKDIIQNENITLLAKIENPEEHDLISVDTANNQIRDQFIKANMANFRNVVEFDHHYGEITPEYIVLLCSDRFKSAAGLIADVFINRKTPISENMALALLTGIVGDTTHLNLMKDLRHTDYPEIIQNMEMLWRLTNKKLDLIQTVEEIEKTLIQGTTDDDWNLARELFYQAMANIGTEKIKKTGKDFDVAYIMVTKKMLENKQLKNWRNILNGFFNNVATNLDIVAMVYYNGVDKTTGLMEYKGSIRRYNKTMDKIDFQTPVKRVFNKGGGGHPTGAVGFTFKGLLDPANPDPDNEKFVKWYIDQNTGELLLSPEQVEKILSDFVTGELDFAQ